MRERKKVIGLAVFVLLAGIAVWALLPRQASPAQAAGDGPQIPKWQPNIPVDITRTIKTMQYYVGTNVSFAVFKNGTCVRIPPTSTNPKKIALATLDALFHKHPEYKTLPMDDGNWLVTYSDQAFSVCFADEINKHWDYIEKNHLDGRIQAETLPTDDNKSNKFDKREKIGLYARARWFMDCQSKGIVMIVKSTSAAPAGSSMAHGAQP